MRLVETLPTNMKRFLFKSVFDGYSIRELQDALSLIRAYFTCNGSVTAMAQVLFVHKNTVQYQLRKLAERTSYDLRKKQDASLYYWVLLLSEAQNI